METLPVRRRTPVAREKFGVCRWLVLFVLLATQSIAGAVCAQAGVVVAPRLTIVVLEDQRIAEDQWAALVVEMRKDFTGLAVETHLVPSSVEIVRGSKIVPGFQVEAIVTVYLHGDCLPRFQAVPRAYQGAALGWVLSDQGRIQPFIHVDCRRIGQMIWPYVLGTSRDHSNAVIAQAISRVVLHEWVHIATQSPDHQRDGISKRAFGIADLIPDYYPRGAHADHGK